MYLSYFGLSEKPFSIAPNPQYLFLSERHKEALAHLTYGLGEAGGFVLLTGEVGTGKTTLTRSLQDQLPENTQVALIYNPALSELELLASICDGFSIGYDEQNATLKTLTDAIKKHLEANHASGGHTILIIDEAQLLSPDVLEQLRLLTNIETNHKKLLQIVLIGQPELNDLLKRNELRQLAQRITARYHLLPLTQGQTFAYVKHRLYVAGCDRTIFTQDALKALYLLTMGVPRLVNLLCERCLVGAFSKQLMMIDSDIVMRSAQEALPPTTLSSELKTDKTSYHWLFPVAFLVVLSMGIGLSFIF
ncbi:AAA family ATPase [Pseudoalteromonas porphyrae]|uniref:AAA family ATPase n=2 Tax=Pseudoalteromonas TaxID=53246 RepID=A0A0N1EIJ3_9GAMM|nr:MULTISPECIES: AAA family ATPase [Pseudoalteromonas]KPH61412.1 AAA family ATPase [Pseudoalteromonas porphyrae]KPH95450.1 AAA family ATPase [Pseudoalteromonas porphyrae]NMR24451.1 AAA family ATPase [Pseudoalteromonas sp. NEC-BIFX-2020_015]NNG42102.1 AAA family ATPase [Pseudoalteromonas sp. NEC-BIFX-2020_002]